MMRYGAEFRPRCLVGRALALGPDLYVRMVALKGAAKWAGLPYHRPVTALGAAIGWAPAAIPTGMCLRGVACGRLPKRAIDRDDGLCTPRGASQGSGRLAVSPAVAHARLGWRAGARIYSMGAPPYRPSL